MGVLLNRTGLNLINDRETHDRYSEVLTDEKTTLTALGHARWAGIGFKEITRVAPKDITLHIITLPALRQLQWHCRSGFHLLNWICTEVYSSTVSKVVDAKI